MVLLLGLFGETYDILKINVSRVFGHRKHIQVSWLIGASVPILWGQLDAVAVQFREGNADVAAAWGINGLMWWLSGFPVSVLCVLALNKMF